MSFSSSSSSSSSTMMSSSVTVFVLLASVLLAFFPAPASATCYMDAIASYYNHSAQGYLNYEFAALQWSTGQTPPPQYINSATGACGFSNGCTLPCSSSVVLYGSIYSYDSFTISINGLVLNTAGQWVAAGAGVHPLHIDQTTVMPGTRTKFWQGAYNQGYPTYVIYYDQWKCGTAQQPFQYNLVDFNVNYTDTSTHQLVCDDDFVYNFTSSCPAPQVSSSAAPHVSSSSVAKAVSSSSAKAVSSSAAAAVSSSAKAVSSSAKAESSSAKAVSSSAKAESSSAKAVSSSPKAESSSSAKAVVSSSSAAPQLPSSSSSSTAGRAYSDPRIGGFWGQDVYVEGVGGEVYSLLSDADVQVNVRFELVSGSSIHCPQYSSTPCFNHTGTYFGALAIAMSTGQRLVVEAGDLHSGFSLVRVDEAVAPATSSPLHRLKQLLGLDSHSSTFSVEHVSYRELRVQAGLYTIDVSNMDHYVDVSAVRVTCWKCMEKAEPEGLLGRTWRMDAPVPTDDAAVDSYRVPEHNLYGCSSKDTDCKTEVAK